jgi:hypothetical protein
MLKRILSLFALGLLVSPSLLHADIITPFSLDGFTFQTPATLTGTVTIDITTGIVTGIDATYTAGSLTDELTTLNTFVPPFLGGYATVGATSAPGNLQISLPVSSLVGYTGGMVCTYPVGKNCGAGPVTNGLFMVYEASEFSTPMLNFNEVQSGELDPVPTLPTPEPSSILLLSTGLLAAAASTRPHSPKRQRRDLYQPQVRNPTASKG